ncbi:MAG: 4-(cytidine 5'-diphospho)-2-C-methyl-D-erythritol kinase [Akkermansiaceae bacterium]
MSEIVHREIAKAKVNLSLEVLGKREDGFHALTTRMAPISLADELEFYRADKYILECDTEGVPLDESNLVSMAVRLFERETGVESQWGVKLTKHVPHGAGLGGGSGDAAAVMRGLNKLEGAGLSVARMAELLGEIGSDVPFFVYDSVCDCSGRGEIVEPVEWDHEVTMLLLKPSFGVSTPEAYKAWAGARELPGVDYSAQKLSWGELVNDLEKPVFMKHRFLAEMKMWLLAQAEVEGAMMSGSGSTFMAILDKKNAEKVLGRAREELDPTLWGMVVDLG